MAEHPAIAFKDGSGGRRAALHPGPDIWEIIMFLNEIDERGKAAIAAAAEVFAQAPAKITLALDYYTTHKSEIDAEIIDANDASIAAEAAWRTQQQLLA